MQIELRILFYVMAVYYYDLCVDLIAMVMKV